MKSMKKMLCLFLVAMLLVAAIPVAASADDTVGVQEVAYSVLFTVYNGSNYYYSNPVAYISVPENASDDTIRAAAAGAVAKAGITTVTGDVIVDRVAAKGDADAVHNVIYQDVVTVVDRTNKQFNYVLRVTARPSVATSEVTAAAKIYLDSEGTGNFIDTGKTVNVTMVATTTTGTTPTTTYALKSNGGASVVDIQGQLGANYANKQLSIRFECPTTSGTDASRAAYYVTVTGTNGSTGTNVPSTGNNTNNNNGVPGASGGASGNNSTTIPNGNGSSSNGGSTGNGSSNNGGVGNSGYDFGTNGRTVNFMCDGKVVYSKLVKNDAELEVAKAEAVKAIQALGCYKFKGWK